MTGATHASIGAALGAIIRRPALAFLAGVFYHLAADAVPHRDIPAVLDIAILMPTLAYIAKRHGAGSPQFLGALGGVAPDLEHALVKLGVIRLSDEVFPTHVEDGRWHGRDSGERIGQLLTFAAGLLVAEMSSGCSCCRTGSERR